MDVLFWGIMAVVFIVVEVMTVQLVSVWLAVGAFATMICSCFGDIPFWAELLVFVAVSAVCLAISMPIIMRKRNSGYIPTNSELDVGKKAVVAEEINPDTGTGRVTLSGVDWSAVSESGEVIPKDSIVTVSQVQGAKLIVRIQA